MTEVSDKSEYKIIGSRTVNISDLQEFDIRDKRNENKEKFQELVNSIKSGTIIAPLIVTLDEGNGKYSIIAGNRRFRAIKAAGGITEIPVLLVDTPPENMRKAALTENIFKLDMTDEEITNTLRDIFADNNFKDENEIISHLHRLHNKHQESPKQVPENFKKLVAAFGMPVHRQWWTMKKDRDLTTDTKKFIRQKQKEQTENDPGTQKKTNLLMSPEIKKDSGLQLATAKIISDMNDDDAVRFVDNVKAGNIKHHGSSFQMRSGNKWDTVTTSKEAKRVQQYGSFYIEGTETASKLIRILTHQIIRGKKTKVALDEAEESNQTLIDNSRDFRLQSMKRMHETELNRMVNYLQFLREIIDDTMPMIEREIETQKDKGKLMER